MAAAAASDFNYQTFSNFSTCFIVILLKVVGF